MALPFLKMEEGEQQVKKVRENVDETYYTDTIHMYIYIRKYTWAKRCLDYVSTPSFIYLVIPTYLRLCMYTG